MSIPIIIILLSLLICVLILIGCLVLSKNEIKITDNATDLSEVLPIQYIDDNFIVNGNGDITVGYKIFLPEVFTLSDEAAENIHNRLEGLLGMLPAGTIIHQQNFYYTTRYKNQEHSDNYLQAENLAYYDGKAIIHSYSNIYLTFCNKKAQKRNYAASSLLRKQNFPFNQPFKDFVKLKEDIESVIMNFENGLSAISLFVIKKMRDHDLNNAIYDYINQSYDTPTEDATKQVCNPIAVTPESNLKVGNKLVAVLSLIEEGATLDTNTMPHTSSAHALGSDIQVPSGIRSKCSMIFPLGLGLPFNHVLNTVIEITDSDAVVTAVRSEKNSLNFLANFYQPAKEKQREQEDFCNLIMKEQYRTAYTAVNVIISDADKQELNRKIALAQQGFVNMNQAACYVENEESCNLLFSTIPGNARANYRGFVNTTKQAICYLQKENMYLSDERGYIFSDRFGTPVKINLWNYSGLANRNKILIGPSGSGKSFLLNNYILQSVEKKNDIMIIDIGGSYRSLIDLNRGKYFDSTERKKFAFNPFLCPKDKAGNYIYLDNTDEESHDDLIKTISTILAFIWKGNEKITNAEKALLEKSIRSFYQHVNEQKIFPDLIAYAKFLRTLKLDDYEKEKFDTRELMLLLEPYTDGELSFLLNAKDNVDIVNDNLIAFDMEDVSKKDYFPIIAIITLQLVVDKIKKRQGVAKTLIIDEALDFLKDEKFGDFIGYLYRTFRKKEGEVILAAQNVLFIKMAAPLIRDSIIINCATKIILDHSEHRSNLIEVKNILSITDDECDMIESLQKDERWREFFIKIGNDSYVFKNEVAPVAAVAFDSRQATVVELKQLFKETGSTYAALNKYLELHRLGK